MIRVARAATLRGLRGQVARLRTDAAVARIQAASLKEQRDRALAAVEAINRQWAAYAPYHGDTQAAYAGAARVQEAVEQAMALRKVAANYDELQNIPTEHLEA